MVTVVASAALLAVEPKAARWCKSVGERRSNVRERENMR